MNRRDARGHNPDESGSEHVPVLRQTLLERIELPENAVIYDLTIGQAGHTLAFAERIGPGGMIVGLDADPNSLKAAKRKTEGCQTNILLFHENFRNIKRIQAENQLPLADLILADLGFCSAQLGDTRRGLSFMENQPLDMRLDPRIRETAADILERLEADELANLLFTYAQERASRRIAQAIAEYKRQKSIRSTSELAVIVCKALNQPLNRPGRKLHPATKTFQALRIAVNDELGALEEMLAAAPALLSDAGQIAVISFHSLEDRIVKLNFKKNAQEGLYEIMTKKPLEADRFEVDNNPRARSAKLRIAKKTQQKKGVSL